MRVLVVNAGSSSLKLRVLDDHDAVVAGDDLGRPDGLRPGEVAAALGRLGRFEAVGHRIVHGGERYRAPARLDAAVRRHLAELVPLAPLHQPAGLRGVDLVARLAPGVPAVACFDTAFHADLPAAAATYAVPADWREGLGVRRYGFHGLSHAHAARRSAELLGAAPADLRVVTCHLGAGASLAAVAGGRSRDTTMGFTPLEGLVMATRSGSVDPGALLWLLESRGLAPAAVREALEHRSGLAGLAGTADMAAVVERAGRGDAAADAALDVYAHRLRAGIAAMAAALGGLDALAFTGGVGENAPEVRRRATAGLGFLGVELAPGANRAATGDAEVTAPGAPVRTLVVEAREDLEIARATRSLLSAPTPPP